MDMNRTIKTLFKPLNLRKSTTTLAAAALFTASSTFAQVLDRVAAVVNEDVVMVSEVNERIRSIKAQFKGQEDRLPPDAILIDQIIDRLVIESLQIQMANRANVDYSDEEVNQSIARIAAGNKMNVDQFRQAVESEGQSWAEFRAQVKKEMKLNAVKQGVLQGRVSVSEAEIENFLNSEQGKMQTADSYRVSHILLAVNSRSSAEEKTEAEAKANEIFERASKGEDFGRLAITYSRAQDALQGGDLGWRQAAELPTIFAEKVTDLQAGDVAPVFRSGSGYHIVKVVDRRGPTKQIVKQTQVRHILVAPNDLRDDEASLKLANELYQRLNDGEDFAALAKEHSDDPGSKQSGGELGWAMPGQFVPEFEQTMANAKVGKVAMPFRSQFGWHVLEVMDRRDQDMSDEYLKRQAGNILMQRKMEAETPRWLQELRDDAFIDIRINKQIDGPEKKTDSDE